MHSRWQGQTNKRLRCDEKGKPVCTMQGGKQQRLPWQPLLSSSAVPCGTAVLPGSFFGGWRLFRRHGCLGGLCQERAGGKADPLVCRQMRRCPTTDGFDRAGRNAGQLPGPKADEAHLVAFADFFAHGLRQRIKHRICLFEPHMGLGGDQMGQFLFANDLARRGICCGHELVDLAFRVHNNTLGCRAPSGLRTCSERGRRRTRCSPSSPKDEVIPVYLYKAQHRLTLSGKIETVFRRCTVNTPYFAELGG